MMSGQTRQTGLVLALGVGLLIVAATGTRAVEEKISGDLKKMQGEWVPGSGDAPESHWKIEGHTLETKIKDKEYESKITLKENEQPHPAIDFEVIKGPEDTTGKTVLGIYKLDGDRLTFCIAHPGRDVRPTEFKTIEDEQVLIELKRK